MAQNSILVDLTYPGKKNSPKVYILFNDYIGDEKYPKRCNNESLPLSTASPSTTKSGSDQSHAPDNLLNYAMEKLITLTGHVFALLVQNTKRLVLTVTIEPQSAEEPKIISTSTPTPLALPQSSGTSTNHTSKLMLIIKNCPILANFSQ